MTKERPAGDAPVDQLSFEWLERARGRLRLSAYTSEALGVLLLAMALLTTLGLLGHTSGAWLEPWLNLWRRWLGWGSLLVALGLALAGWRLLRPQRGAGALPWAQILALELAAFAGLGLLSIVGGASLERAEMGLDGGLVGWGLSASLNLLLERLLPDWLANLLGGLLFGAVALLGLLWGVGRMRRARGWLAENRGGADYGGSRAVSVSPASGAGSPAAQEAAPRRRSPRLPAEYRKDFKVGAPVAGQLANVQRDADLPPLDLLGEERSARPDEKHINRMAGLLEKTLAEFGIPARVVNFQVGPTITQFAVEPGYLKDDPDGTRQKVRVSQIAALQRDLALALSAQRLRIQAPVPGRSYIGVEVPNPRSSLVRLRPILESEEFHRIDSALAIALGRDVSGAPLAADLSKMPHLLVAGTTGSGKSVLISAITVCLAMNNSPADLRLVMLDPKMVELVRFNGLPHLIGQVETELDRITAVLRWVVAEMQRRYKLLEEARARDIEGYNQKARGTESEVLPRIVVLIDELADLMMSAAEHTESTLVRLAQMARATGIHLVVATQRPSTDVVTGLIKANFPARISFAVASAIDSRVVLDSSGAEALLGRGDMLYLAPEAAAPTRSQGVMITDAEIEQVVDYWQGAWDSEEDEAPWDTLIQREAVLDDRDELVEEAIEVIRQTGKSSASHLQRALRVGYPRAARLVDQLEDLGVLGPSLGGGREREVLIDLDSYDVDEDEDE